MKDRESEVKRATTAALNGNAWMGELLLSEKGKPLALVENAILSLKNDHAWHNVIALNQSTLHAVVRNPPPWEENRPTPYNWTDVDDIRAAAWLQRQGVHASVLVASHAVQCVALANPYHPIRDYLNALMWDGVPRLDDWLTTYLGVERSNYVSAVGAKWMIGAVARVFRPGCKMDTCPVFEGPQGTFKSTALRIMGGQFFTDEIADLGTKDSSIQLRGAWIIELSELDAMSRAEISKVKAFMTRQVDRFRPPYGRNTIEAPRECVFAGTVNQNTYLRDETGARRWWPIRCGFINVEQLRTDRDQLWAEAVDRFKTGESWWLESQEIIASATAEQAERYESDPWEDKISYWSEDRETVSVSEILEQCLEKPKFQWTRLDQMRVASVLIAMRWKRFQRRDNGSREWRYRRILAVTDVRDAPTVATPLVPHVGSGLNE